MSAPPLHHFPSPPLPSSPPLSFLQGKASKCACVVVSFSCAAGALSQRSQSDPFLLSRARDSSEGNSALHTMAREGGSAVLRGLAKASLGVSSSPAVPSSRGQGSGRPGADPWGETRGGGRQAGPSLRGRGSQLKREALKTLRSGVRAALDMNKEEILTTILKVSEPLPRERTSADCWANPRYA